MQFFSTVEGSFGGPRRTRSLMKAVPRSIIYSLIGRSELRQAKFSRAFVFITLTQHDTLPGILNYCVLKFQNFDYKHGHIQS
jgi:hypothetical protein